MTDPVVPFYQFDYKPSVQRSAQINYGIVHFYRQNRPPWTPCHLMFHSKPVQWESEYGGVGCLPNPMWIENAADLKTLIGWLKLEMEFCIHVRRMKYNAVVPFTTLIQIGTWKRGDFLISAMQLRDEIEKHFKSVLENPKILKVMCKCPSQVLALQRDFNIYIYGVADVCELIRTKKPSVKNYKAVCSEFSANECQELVHLSSTALVEKVSQDHHIHYATHQVHFVLRLFNKLRREATQKELNYCFDNSRILSDDVCFTLHEEVTRISLAVASTEYLRILRINADLWKETLDNRNPEFVSDRERRNIVSLIEWRLMVSKVTNVIPETIMTDLKLFELSVLPYPTPKRITAAIGNLGYVVDQQLNILSQILSSESPEEVMRKLREHECHNCLTRGHGPAAFCIFPRPPTNETIMQYMNRPGNEERRQNYIRGRDWALARQAILEEEAAAAYQEMKGLVW